MPSPRSPRNHAAAVSIADRRQPRSRHHFLHHSIAPSKPFAATPRSPAARPLRRAGGFRQPRAADLASASAGRLKAWLESNRNDGGVPTIFGALTFSEGRHTLAYRSIDGVGNVETVKTLSLRSDATPPLTTFTPSGTFFTGADGARFAPPSFSYGLAAVDPAVGDVASGPAFTRYSLDFGPLLTYATTFTLTEGVRRVDFQSEDNLGHLELLRGVTVYVDAAAPASSLTIGSPSFDPGAGQPVFVAPATRFSLAAADPLSGGVAAGLRLISLRRGADPFMVYASSFGLTAPDGLKTVEHFADDNVGNVETAQSKTFALDGTAPATSLSAQGGRQPPGPDAASFYAPADPRLAPSAADLSSIPSPQAWRSSSTRTTAARSKLRRRAEPRRGQRPELPEPRPGREPRGAAQLAILIDATPPVTTVQIGLPLHQPGRSTTSQPRPSPSAPPIPRCRPASPARSLARIEVSMDGGPFVPRPRSPSPRAGTRCATARSTTSPTPNRPARSRSIPTTRRRRPRSQFSAARPRPPAAPSTPPPLPASSCHRSTPRSMASRRA